MQVNAIRLIPVIHIVVKKIPTIRVFDCGYFISDSIISTQK